MRIAVYGYTGSVGREITAEAIARGHHVTGISRKPARRAVPAIAGNLTDLDLFRIVADHNDAVVIAVPPSRTGGNHAEHAEAHRGIAEMQPAARLLVIGGAGALRAGDGLLRDSASFPQAFKAEAVTMAEVLSIYQSSPRLDWTMLTPPPLIAPGERTGRYTTGGDSPAGTSISTQDFAVAALDELERPRHRRTRFTVAGTQVSTN